VEIINYLLEPFTYGFMQKAFIIIFFVSIPTALLSCFLVLKGWALMGDSVAHSILPGVVISYIIGIPFLIGAFIAGIVSSILTGFLSENSRIKEDTVMGIVFSSMFALGIVLISKIDTSVHLDHILFGDLLGIGSFEIIQTGLIGLSVLIIILIKGPDFMVYVFDPMHAKALGMPVSFLRYALLAVLSLTIVGALQAVGMILVIALLITPAAIAHLLTNRLNQMIKLSVCISLVGCFTGIYLSYFIDSAPAPTIIVVLAIAFIVAFISVISKKDPIILNN
jgi:manganese/iron transport system permease protein